MEFFFNASVVALDATEMEMVAGGDSQVLHNLGYGHGQAARDFVKQCWIDTLPCRVALHLGW